jgi:hypothetical protein
MTAEFYPGSKKPIRPPEPPDGEEPWRRRGKPVSMSGRQVRLYTIGSLAEALERKPITIRGWERDGIIPRSTFVKRGVDGKHGRRRMYSEAQIDGIVKIAHDMGLVPNYGAGRRDVNMSEFSARVLELFKNLARGSK